MNRMIRVSGTKICTAQGAICAKRVEMSLNSGIYIHRSHFIVPLVNAQPHT